MTTPALNTPYAIIDAALRQAGRLSEGATPTPEQYASCMGDLQRIINFRQTQGLKLWLQEDLSIPLVQGQGGVGNPYTLTPSGSVNMTKPLRAQQGFYLDSSQNRRPVYPLSWDEWNRLSQVSQQGAVSQYFIDKQATSLNAYTWLIPDATAATGQMVLMLQQQVTNPISLTETMNFPLEWNIALVWALADERATGQPAEIMTRCAQKATFYWDALENWDVEDAPTSFAPDMRQGGYGMGNFL